MRLFAHKHIFYSLLERLTYILARFGISVSIDGIHSFGYPTKFEILFLISKVFRSHRSNKLAADLSFYKNEKLIVDECILMNFTELWESLKKHTK